MKLFCMLLQKSQKPRVKGKNKLSSQVINMCELNPLVYLVVFSVQLVVCREQYFWGTFGFRPSTAGMQGL